MAISVKSDGVQMLQISLDLIYRKYKNNGNNIER